MESLYLWPDRPALSLLTLWIVSVILLWAARDPALQVVEALSTCLQHALDSLADWCRGTAQHVRERARRALFAAGELELRGKLEREFHRIDVGFSERLTQYSELHRRLDDVVHRAQVDYGQCGDVPPEVPGWSAAIETISSLPTSPDPNVQRILEGIRKSSREAEKKALAAHRAQSSRRHKILGGMAPHLKEIKNLLGRMKETVASALETATRVNQYVDAYEEMGKEEEVALRALTFSAIKLFTVSLIVLGIAAGGAFINFQLIALPMSELVPAGARIGGIPVSTVSALVIVLMETAVGIFIMDMLGITELFPRLGALAASRRRLILGVCVFGLFMLASVESSLAILREQIVEADAALKLALAGTGSAPIREASSSMIPVIGQAVLGFILPFILAMVAIPLEMLLDSARHVTASLVEAVLGLTSGLARVLSHSLKAVLGVFPSVYDVYISVPLRIERMLRREPSESGPKAGEFSRSGTTA